MSSNTRSLPRVSQWVYHRGKELIWNPILLRELIAASRGWRLFVFLPLGVFLFAVLIFLIYLPMYSSLEYSVGVSLEDMARSLFGVFFFIALFFSSSIIPAVTSGSIVGERERRTLDLLRVSLLSPSKIVLGKLGAALCYVFLFLIATVPIQGLIFLFGRLSLLETLGGYSILIVTILLYATYGLYASTVSGSSRVATFLGYGISGIALFAIPALAGGLLLSFYFLEAEAPVPPSVELHVFLIYLIGFLFCLNPFSASIISEAFYLDRGSVFYHTLRYQPTSTASAVYFYVPSPWYLYLLFSMIQIVLFLRLAIRRLERKG